MQNPGSNPEAEKIAHRIHTFGPFTEEDIVQESDMRFSGFGIGKGECPWSIDLSSRDEKRSFAVFS